MHQSLTGIKAKAVLLDFECDRSGLQFTECGMSYKFSSPLYKAWKSGMSIEGGS